MRCKELVKHHKDNRGVIMMTIDGLREEVEQVEKALDAEFPGANTMCEEDGERDGEISISFQIDRNEKAYFMVVYNGAKKAA